MCTMITTNPPDDTLDPDHLSTHQMYYSSSNSNISDPVCVPDLHWKPMWSEIYLDICEISASPVVVVVISVSPWTALCDIFQQHFSFCYSIIA